MMTWRVPWLISRCHYWIGRFIATGCDRFAFVRFDGFLAPYSVSCRNGFLRKTMNGVCDAGPSGIVRFRCDLVGFRVVFGAGASPTHNAGRVLVDMRHW